MVLADMGYGEKDKKHGKLWLLAGAEYGAYVEQIGDNLADRFSRLPRSTRQEALTGVFWRLWEATMQAMRLWEGPRRSVSSP